MPGKLKFFTTIATALFSIGCDANSAWKPEPRFSIEGSSYVETLTFVSGFAYALSYTARQLDADKLHNFFCLPENVRIDSRLLIDIANESLSGDSSSEDVSSTIIQGLASKYPCESN